MSHETEKPSAFCSFDIEADGTNPLEHSMRSLGIGLFSEDSGLVDTFYKTIQPQKHSDGTRFSTDPIVMKDFWEKHPAQWKEVNHNAQEPSTVMYLLSRWLEKYKRKYTIKWVARPSNCDWMWLKSYYEFYGPPRKPPIGHYCHDLSSLLRSYTLCHNVVDKKNLIQKLSSNFPYTHNALDDAICQGHIYMNLRTLLNHNAKHNFSYIVPHKGMDILVTSQAYILPSDPKVCLEDTLDISQLISYDKLIHSVEDDTVEKKSEYLSKISDDPL
jgi:hypothetical protein